MFLFAEQSLQGLVEMVEHHRGYCKESLKLKKSTERDMLFLQTSGNISCEHSSLWSSSPYLSNKEYLVNTSVNNSFSCSCMLSFHYVRFLDGDGIGKISKHNRQELFQNVKNMYRKNKRTPFIFLFLKRLPHMKIKLAQLT